MGSITFVLWTVFWFTLWGGAELGSCKSSTQLKLTKQNQESEEFRTRQILIAADAWKLRNSQGAETIAQTVIESDVILKVTPNEEAEITVTLDFIQDKRRTIDHFGLVSSQVVDTRDASRQGDRDQLLRTLVKTPVTFWMGKNGHVTKVSGLDTVLKRFRQHYVETPRDSEEEEAFRFISEIIESSYASSELRSLYRYRAVQDRETWDERINLHLGNFPEIGLLEIDVKLHSRVSSDPSSPETLRIRTLAQDFQMATGAPHTVIKIVDYEFAAETTIDRTRGRPLRAEFVSEYDIEFYEEDEVYGEEYFVMRLKGHLQAITTFKTHTGK